MTTVNEISLEQYCSKTNLRCLLRTQSYEHRVVNLSTAESNTKLNQLCNALGELDKNVITASHLLGAKEGRSDGRKINKMISV